VEILLPSPPLIRSLILLPSVPLLLSSMLLASQVQAHHSAHVMLELLHMVLALVALAVEPFEVLAAP
jgi:hypothetical protein